MGSAASVETLVPAEEGVDSVGPSLCLPNGKPISPSALPPGASRAALQKAILTQESERLDACFISSSVVSVSLELKMRTQTRSPAPLGAVETPSGAVETPSGAAGYADPEVLSSCLHRDHDGPRETRSCAVISGLFLVIFPARGLTCASSGMCFAPGVSRDGVEGKVRNNGSCLKPERPPDGSGEKPGSCLSFGSFTGLSGLILTFGTSCLICQEEEAEVPSPPALSCCQTRRDAASPAHAQ